MVIDAFSSLFWIIAAHNAIPWMGGFWKD